MRFLLTRTAERVCVLKQQPTAAAPPQIIPLAERKWGQHCGESCTCVLRMEVGVDAEDRVVSANYRAKRLVPSHQQPTTANMFRSRRTGKIQMTNASCPTLHALAKKSCEFSMGKRVGQIQNSLYSSPSIRRASLSMQDHNPTSNSGCYDLVHSTLTATFEGYIPTLTKSVEKGTPQQQQDDDIPASPLVSEPSPAVLWWDRATQADEGASASIFSATTNATQQQSELLPVDWVSYVDQLEEETA